MGEEIDSFTESQKNLIYKEMLVPLKVKISQILLYDTKTALQLLQEYNEIVENEDSLGNSIIKEIAELEFKIQSYMSNDGKEKLFEEVSDAILQIIAEFEENFSQLTLEEAQSRFSALKANYENNLENYSFKDRERIEKEIYALQASLIMRQVAEGKFSTEMQQKMTNQDKNGLNMFVLEWIDSLSSKDGLKNIADKVKAIVLADNDAVLRPEIWTWMNVAEKGINYNKQLQASRQATNSTAMIVPSKNRNNVLLGLGYLIKNGISRLFSKEPRLPLEVGDLKKINIEWLSRYVPESMLLKLEQDRLEKENNGTEGSVYLPDSKTPIYQMLQERAKTYDALRNDDKYEDARNYDIFTENMGKKSVLVEERHGFGHSCTITIKSKDNNIKREARRRYYDYGVPRLNDALIYAGLLDQIFGINLQQQLMKEIQDVYFAEKSKKDSIYIGLTTSLRKMYQQYMETGIDFEATEEENRRKFYEMHGFKEKQKQHYIEDRVVVQSPKEKQTIEQEKGSNETEPEL